MRFRSLTHVLEVVSSLAHPDAIVVLGSSSLLAIDPNLGDPGEPLELSYDADLLIRPIDQDLAAVLTEAVGEQSLFAKRNKYYADILRPAIVETLPSGWDERLGQVPEFNNAHALNPYDLALVKLTLGRPKDLSLLRALLNRQLINAGPLREHYQMTPLDETDAAKIGRNIRTLLD